MKISKVIFHIKPIPSHPWWECKNILDASLAKKVFVKKVLKERIKKYQSPHNENSRSGNLSLLTNAIKRSESDICVNKANPRGILVVLQRGFQTRSSSFNHRFYLVNKAIIPSLRSFTLALQSASDQLESTETVPSHPAPWALDQKCNLHPFMSWNWNICELIRTTGLWAATGTNPSFKIPFSSFSDFQFNWRCSSS